MANFSDDDLEELKKIFDGILQSGKHSAEREKLEQQMYDLTKKMRIEDEKGLLLAKKLNQSHADLIKEYNKGRMSAGDLTRQLQKYDEALEDATYEIKNGADERTKAEAAVTKKIIEENKKQLGSMLAVRTGQELFAGAAAGASKTMAMGARGLATTFGDMISHIAQGGDGFDMAKNVFSTAAMGAATAFQETGNASATLGSGLLALKGPLKIIGGILVALGIAADGAAAGLKAANWAVGLLTDSAKRMFDSFMKSSQAGLIFANGAAELGAAAHAAGLTTADYANIAHTNAELLGESGLGLAGAMDRVGKALTQGGQRLRYDLFKLGFNFEEQGQVVAEVMSNMRMAGADISKLSSGEIARTTKEYAMNLRAISAITGDDAKKRMQQAREAAANLAFQQKLSTMDVKQQQNIIAAMGAMNEVEKKNFMDRMVLGTVINQTGAVFEATVAGAAQKGQEAVNAAMNGSLTLQDQIERNGRYQAQLQDGLQKQTGLAIAGYASGTGLAADLAKSFYDVFADNKKWSQEVVKTTLASLNKLEKQTDATTQGLINVQVAAKGFEVYIETQTQKYIGLIADATTKMLNETRKLLEEGISGMQELYGKGSGKPNDETDKTKHDIVVDTIQGDAAYGGLQAGKVAADLSNKAKEAADAAKVSAATIPETVNEAGKATSKVAEGLADAGMAAKGAAEEIPAVTGGLLKFAKAIPYLSAALETGLAGFGVYGANKLLEEKKISSKEAHKREGEAIGGGVGSLGGMAGGALLGGAIGTAIPIPVLGTILGALVGGALGLAGGYGGKKLGGAIGEHWDQRTKMPDDAEGYSDPGFAMGGIASGPATGFRATLHGTEAIVPLSDNRSIPVQFDSPLDSMPDMSSLASGSTATVMKQLEDLLTKLGTTSPDKGGIGTDITKKPGQTTDMADVVEVLKDQVDLMRAQLNKSERMLTAMSEQVSVSRDILNNSL